jgi:hypothetical protein
LPDDELLLAEFAAVRLRKNSLGIYRLDHDAGQHDDQAIALALGAHHLLDGDPEPLFVIFDEPEVPPCGKNEFGIEVFRPMDRFAVRADPADPGRRPGAGTMRRPSRGASSGQRGWRIRRARERSLTAWSAPRMTAPCAAARMARPGRLPGAAGPGPATPGLAAVPPLTDRRTGTGQLDEEGEDRARVRRQGQDQ